MKYKIVPSNKFKKDLKLAIKRSYDISLLEQIVESLSHGKRLPARYKDHALSGNYSNCRECHITPDWLLVYEISENELILYLTRTGTHSDLFYYLYFGLLIYNIHLFYPIILDSFLFQ